MKGVLEGARGSSCRFRGAESPRFYVGGRERGAGSQLIFFVKDVFGAERKLLVCPQVFKRCIEIKINIIILGRYIFLLINLERTEYRG